MMRTRAVLSLLLLLPGCDEGGDDAPVALGPTLSGALTPFTPGVASVEDRAIPADVRAAAARLIGGRHRAALVADAPGFTPGFRPRDFVPGQVVVRLRDEPSVVGRLHERPGLGAWRFSVAAWGTREIVALQVRRADGETPDHDETALVAATLNGHPSLRYAHLNHYKRALRTPNDEYYSLQWHYQQIGMPAAWDLSTGSGDVVCAVVDDGVNPHPDFGERRLGGYDMISDTRFSGDGDGRDGQPEQVPGSHGGQSVWHGTHVAGTVGAAANGQAVVGMDWACRILPVRVLGVADPNLGQGTSIDIIAGIAWAAGLQVPDAPRNANPAAVINLSLGGGPLVQAEQDVIDAATGAGAILVVAAGNSNQDAGASSLAGYDNVIVVGAVDYTARRAPYSNFGAVVDVMAPGGNMSADANADGYPDGVLSTYLTPDGRSTGAEFLEGTSMAAPHVTGLVALMKAVQPGLTGTRAEQILKDTADRGSRCDEGCGAGLVNAPAALAAAGARPSGPAKLQVSAERINLGGGDRGQVMLFNAGGEGLGWQASVRGAAAGAVRLGTTSGELAPGASAALAVRVEREGLADGTHQATLDVRGGGEATVAVIFTVGAAPVADVGVIQVGAVAPTADGGVVVGGEGQTDAAGGYRYSFGTRPGEWLVVAVADRNQDGVLGSGDLLGFWRGPDQIEPVFVGDAPVGGLDFTLVPVSGDDLGEPPCTAVRRCWEGCGGEQACVNACPIDSACQQCFDATVRPCLDRACPDGSCACVSCVGEVGTCFGPNACTGGGGGASRPVGAPCTGAECAAPYACETEVPGGYCTALCEADANCPGGTCVAFDQDGDGFADLAACLAPCTGPGTCPRAQDACTVIDTGAAVCVPGG